MNSKFYESLTENHTNIILDSVADGVFTVDEDMRITYFNRAAEKITGITRDQAVGQFCFDILKANICEKSCALRCSLESESEVVNKHVNILRTDGKQIPVSISTAVLRDEEGNKVGGVETLRDLSPFEVLQKEIRCAYTLEDIISKNHRIRQIFDILPNIAESDSTVLIQGPSGSGKELFARAIHNLSPRNQHAFIAINCGALPDTLLESELFGYVKGAFTDAKKNKPGRFALAKGGTVFLDEVESLSPAMQVKLLRVLQEKEFEPLGAISAVQTDVRVIAATKNVLSEMVNDGTFRDDLFFRLNVVKLELPLLRERRDDIPILVEHFIEKFNHKMRRRIESVSGNVLQLLMQYDFPGNIRELENIIEHAFVMCRGEIIQLHHLPIEFSQRKPTNPLNQQEPMPLQAAEQHLLREVLEKHDWNKVATAKELGVHRATLYRKMKKHGL
ncbi:MAG: sigma 54-interacting transcriptional regulator [Deferribacteres bacterium]|nr:sigma 54-interacting transcriptional regulator [candidate division KSB1 bacterium]MCB9500343.1 sigma 54-interacting transcriptional regulator [Deferribacteres bacterium]